MFLFKATNYDREDLKIGSMALLKNVKVSVGTSGGKFLPCQKRSLPGGRLSTSSIHSCIYSIFRTEIAQFWKPDEDHSGQKPAAGKSEMSLHAGENGHAQ